MRGDKLAGLRPARPCGWQAACGCNIAGLIFTVANRAGIVPCERLAVADRVGIVPRERLVGPRAIRKKMGWDHCVVPRAFRQGLAGSLRSLANIAGSDPSNR
ncbi:hypothetical protein PRIPAC_89048, partial [Pristionchus pacificus]|uniref:Uncharacterized protein n=1 Tax=Pristionchus pacificus TaxID=54126 RepID=A0A2A6CIX0_PRIPA